MLNKMIDIRLTDEISLHHFLSSVWTHEGQLRPRADGALSALAERDSTMQFKVAAAIVMLAGVAAFGQSNNGTITGTVSDPAGAVVTGAVIEVKNVETGVVSRGGTSATGNYVIPVPAGTYEITVQVTGFKRVVQQNIPVVVATDTRKDITLEVGSNTEVVTVAADAP